MSEVQVRSSWFYPNRQQRKLPVRLSLASCNRKLSPVTYSMRNGRMYSLRAVEPKLVTTTISIDKTCPPCPFKNNGCLTQEGYTRVTMNTLDEAAQGWTPRQILALEAAAIDSLWPKGVPQDGRLGGRDLRLHIGGDAPETVNARWLAWAAQRWLDRGGGSVWTYTHSWPWIRRVAWGPIAALASIEHPAEVDHARGAGYVPAITLQRFPSERAFRLPGSDTTWIPCPAETRGTTCVECRLCLDREVYMHRENKGIAFAAHGQGVERVKKALPVIQ